MAGAEVGEGKTVSGLPKETLTACHSSTSALVKTGAGREAPCIQRVSSRAS